MAATGLAGCLGWLRMFDLLTGRRGSERPAPAGRTGVIPLTLPGMAALWLGVGVLGD